MSGTRHKKGFINMQKMEAQRWTPAETAPALNDINQYVSIGHG